MRGPSTLLLAVALSAAAGARAGEAAPEPALEGTRWRLAAWNEKPDSALLRAIDLRFEGGRLGGEGPCNSYSAAYSLKDGSLRLGPIGATKRGCEPDRNELESAWFDALRRLDRLRLETDRLLLTGPAGLRLEFERDAAIGDES